ncbi:Gryzun, putative trafficking through golgi-domain-containing protein [Chaetomium strumarium]|uniref:Gryzun, putative trafficking through golgi-domain-containing protein n=1 Tax=Chaetomium strumarium TaxID=1170767 RepID=A0AAJ0GNM9_9PEZI|nr:Gryzun, putative trafficking through golgi-domain-containing protein [Chaetomium strumarium]
MDEYPAGSLDHNVPLLLTLGTRTGSGYDAGLGASLKEQAVLIRSDLAPLDSDQAHALLRYIRDRDASELPCNGRDASGRKYRFRVKTAERSLLLPPRRARLPEGIEAPSPSATPAPVLHSPYSPLSPISPLYPDGLIDTQWIRKHQELVPSVLLCFYALVSDPTLAKLCDNQIKTDINTIRALLSQSGYKTRLAVVLLSDHVSSAASFDGVQERLETIRRGSGLDSKALFLVPFTDSQEELERVAENMLTTLYTVSIEYYRDLGRHSRKKRGRGTVPQPTVPPTSGTSQTLSLAGWNVRYDFKSAMFAEYRLEMDVALRSYEQAYENLLSSEVMELIPSWSPRWNEARFLADVVSVRCLRCLFWNGQHSAAARRWQFHRERIADLVERQGRGTKNYGWEAWEARWAVVMADLIDKTDIPELAPTTLRLYLPPEKSIMGERLQPWELLHHTGYWHRMAAKHLQARKAFARAIPEDDRRSPSTSPASHVAKSAFAYDTYMCPDPHEEYPLGRAGVDHSQMIVDRLIRARAEFLKRRQARFAAEVTLECARELAVAKDWQNIVQLLRPIRKDMPFRAEGWVPIAEELNWALRTAAAEAGDAELVLLADWELLSRDFTKRPGWHYDITKSLEDVPLKSKPSVSIQDGQLISFVSASFLFKNEEGKAGQSVRSQLCIKSNAHQGSAPVVLQSVYVSFSGSLDGVVLRHRENEQASQHTHSKATVTTVPLAKHIGSDAQPESSTPDEANNGVTLLGSADLTLRPGQTLVFNMEIPLREPGETRADSLTLNVESEAFTLRQSLKFQERSNSSIWCISGSAMKSLPHPHPLAVHVLPRPPKMEIRCPIWREQYYTDEPITLRFEAENGEDVEALARLDVLLFGEKPPAFAVEIPGHEDQVSSSARSEEARLSGVPMGTIASSNTMAVCLRLPPIERSSRFDLTLKVTYFLPTNPGTPISQRAAFQLNIVSPFEANYGLLPRVHPDPWPSLFDPEGVPLPDTGNGDDDNHAPAPPKGISQAWCLVTRYASFASEPLRVTDVDITIQQATPTIRCSSTKRTGVLPASGTGRLVHPKTIEEAAFDLVAQKATVDDRSPAPLDISLIIKWTRPDADPVSVNTTTLPIPRFTLFGTEPRVLASVSHHRGSQNMTMMTMITLTVTIENASSHFLTFGLSMEPSEQFAFSGPKQTSLNLLPVSRRSVAYRLLPLAVTHQVRDESLGGEKGQDEAERAEEEEGGMWIRPALVVRDKYFQKVLRVIPASEGLRAGKEGLEVWVPTLGLGLGAAEGGEE